MAQEIVQIQQMGKALLNPGCKNIGSAISENGAENFKICCGHDIFKEIDSGLRFELASSWIGVDKG